MIPQLFLGEMGIMFLVFFALKDVLYIYIYTCFYLIFLLKLDMNIEFLPGVFFPTRVVK